jgi:hypothetical protein
MVKKELLCDRYMRIRNIYFPVIKHNTIIFNIGIGGKAKIVKYTKANGFYFMDLLNIYAKQYIYCVYDDDIEARDGIICDENEINWNVGDLEERISKLKCGYDFWILEGFEYDTRTHCVEPIMEFSH